VIVTVLWEDQRGVEQKSFAPGVLLEACLRDRRLPDVDAPPFTIDHAPKKGEGNVIKALSREHDRLARKGHVFAVLDRDQIRRHWQKDPPHDCMTGIRERIAKDAGGPRNVLFLVRNMESLVHACCDALHVPRPSEKPGPDERDRIIAKAAWHTDVRVRTAVLGSCASFARLVDKVEQALTTQRSLP
jgi:hypothetical protein